MFTKEELGAIVQMVDLVAPSAKRPADVKMLAEIKVKCLEKFPPPILVNKGGKK